VPPRELLATWRHQAALICGGKFDELAEWQRGYGERASTSRTAIEDEGRTPFLPLMWQCAVLALTVLLALWLCGGSCDETTGPKPTPGTGASPSPTPPTFTISIGSEELFEFDRSTIAAPRARYLTEKLDDLLRTFKTISITEIEAHTDPIGGWRHNQRLSSDRRAAVLEVIREHARVNGRIADETEAAQSTPMGPLQGDREVHLYDYCTRDVRSETGPIRTFKFESDPLRRSRYPIIRSGEGPAMSREGNNKYWLTVNCLAPMRRVDISGKGTFSPIYK